MCVALPGIVERIEGQDAIVNFSGNRIRAAAGFVEPEVGQRVLVHAGYIMQVISESEADEIEDLLHEIEDMA